jgi:hypothetical protein
MDADPETIEASNEHAWTTGADSTVRHVRFIGSGYSGEIHEVVPLIMATNSAALKYHNRAGTSGHTDYMLTVPVGLCQETSTSIR